jgi:hypothetical protein
MKLNSALRFKHVAWHQPLCWWSCRYSWPLAPVPSPRHRRRNRLLSRSRRRNRGMFSRSLTASGHYFRRNSPWRKARKNEYQSLVQLCKALGGGWT